MFFDFQITVKDSKQLHEIVKQQGKTAISYSQFSLYQSCPYAWKLRYVDKIKKDESSINLIFGSAVHTVLQEYLTVYYNKGTATADEIDFNKRLFDEMKNEFIKAKQSLSEGQQDFTNSNTMTKFYYQGIENLNYIKKHRSKYFNRNETELVGVEVPLMIETDSNKNIIIIGFLDVVLKYKKEQKYKIVDIKTSTHGWNKYDKKNFTKNAQVILYKKYYAKQLGLNPKCIDVEFFILKRLLYENIDYKQSYIQVHKPASGTPTLNKTELLLQQFVNIFDETGHVKQDQEFIKTPGDGKKNCKYCYYREFLCDRGITKKTTK